MSREPRRTPASSNVPARWGWSWDPSCSRRTPQRPVGQRLPWVCPCPQQTRNQGLRCEQFTWKHNTRGRSANRGGAIQGRGGTSARGCRGAPSGGRGPLAAGWHHHRPPLGPGPTVVRLSWVLNAQELVAGSRGSAGRRAAGSVGAGRAHPSSQQLRGPAGRLGEMGE